ncbi:acetyl-CoA carboxylase biotin carboxyl carrier protein [Lactiplantibacillus dongliensis]|uniref:Acetyl-CoA carboxylase biotin carboxyl carrier protein n=1 Tax=Lactiplantibacillus dongliensis TaxID=2559919 RepID=A0ABW1R8F5_9LACO|nr:biotin/lipoyl-containing protein [Lactiplantibacillus dongliensis]
MELKDLDRLVEKYARQGYQQIRVKAGELEIEVTKPTTTPVAKAPTAAADKTAVTDTTVTSPMVGVVHLAAELTVGQAVTQGQELGQIESMKLFNPLTAPTNGVLDAILVTDQATVEYGQPLFKLRKDR